MTTEVVEQTEAQKAEQQKTEHREAEAGFAAGYAKVTGQETKPETDTTTTETTETTPEKKGEDKGTAAAPAATAPVKDEWEGVPKVVRDRLQPLEGLPDRLRNIEGHIGGLKSQLNESVATAKAAAAKKGSEVPTDKQIAVALSNEDEFKKFEADFPDFAKPIRAELTALRSELAKKTPQVDVDGLRSEFEGSANELLSKGLAVAEERAYLRFKHPEWKKTINTQEFKTWTLEGGPSASAFSEYKKLEQTDPAKAQEVLHGFARAFPQWWADRGANLFSDAADEAVKLLDGYETHKTKAAEAEAARLKKEKRLEGAVTPKGTSQPPTTGISDEEAFSRGYSRVAKAKK